MFSLVLLAFMQSLTEFLPVSSSGHLVLLEKFGLSNQTLVMDVGLHVGTLLAVMCYFSKDLLMLIKSFFGRGSKRLLYQIITATVPIVCFGVFLSGRIETTFRNVCVIAVSSIFYGLLLWGVDKYARRGRSLAEMTYKDAFLIGLAQVLSLIPGTSRSGITITCARALGINRSDSARFSMLLSIPTISLAAVWIFVSAFLRGRSLEILSADLFYGMILSGIFGFLVIWFLMKWVQKASFAVFGIYRLLLGIFLITLVLKGIL